MAFDVGGVLTRVDHFSDFEETWQERLGLTQAEFGQALASVDPDGMAYTGRLSETQFKARLSAALGLSAVQADEFMAGLAGTGIPHAYLTFEGEQHGFRRAETIQTALEAELSFYGQVFGFTTPGVPVLELRS